MILARQFRPRVRCAISPKGASKLRTLLLSRTLWDKSAGSGHDVYDHSDSTVAKAVCATPADPPQRQATEPNHVYPKARPRAEELLELMRLTADLQQKVTKLNEDVRTGKEANGIHTKKILTGLRKATEGVHIAFELDENQKISRAFQAEGMVFSIRDDIRYMLLMEFRERNTLIHVDPSGRIQEFPSVNPVVKELSIQPELDGPVVNLYISNHFILLLEEVEDYSTAEANLCTEKQFRVETKFLYSRDGELRADATILNRNAWFIRDIQRGFVNFFLKSRHQDVCVQGGIDNPLEVVDPSMCRRNLECQTVGRQDR